MFVFKKNSYSWRAAKLFCILKSDDKGNGRDYDNETDGDDEEDW